MKAVRFHRVGEDAYGRKQYRFKSFHITKWDFDAPMRSTCWRLTHISNASRVIWETDTLAEMREYFCDPETQNL